MSDPHPRTLVVLGVLFSLLFPPHAPADSGDLWRGKIICHLEPAGGACSPLQDGYTCDDHVAKTSSAVFHGDIGSTYTLYILAVDVNTEVGVLEAAFAVDYPEEVVLEEWTVCDATFTAENGWPASAGGVRVRRTGCGGTEPDPTDPEGDASVVLGSFQVTAYDKSRFRITPRKFAAGGVLLTDCQGGITNIAESLDNFVNLGYAVFGDDDALGQAPCAFNGVADCSCEFGLSRIRRICCCHGATGVGYECTSGRACEYGGGSAYSVECAKPCGEYCAEVAADPATWSRIKSRHD